VNATYFIQVQSVALTFFGILAGLSMRFLHRYKVYRSTIQYHSSAQPCAVVCTRHRTRDPSNVSLRIIPTKNAHLRIPIRGVAMMIHSRGGNASDAELVWTQILQGFGGGFAAVSSQVGAQASVHHADVGIITAVVLLLTEIGGAVGNACGMFALMYI